MGRRASASSGCCSRCRSPIAVAVLRYRLDGIDVVINRTLVYGALTAVVVGIYVLVVGYLGAALRREDDLLVSLVATGMVAVLFAPLRDRLQRAVNRLLYGERDEPYAALSRLGRQLEGTLAPDAVLPAIVETVPGALRLPYAAIALRRRRAAVESAATPVRRAVRLPLLYRTAAGRRAGARPAARARTASPRRPPAARPTWPARPGWPSRRPAHRRPAALPRAAGHRPRGGAPAAAPRPARRPRPRWPG